MTSEHEFPKRSQLWLKIKNSTVAFFKILPDKEFVTISSVIICLMTGKNANIGHIYEFCDFDGFRKAVATAFLGMSKIPIVKFEIKFFYLFKNLCFPVTQICAPTS